MRMNIKRAESLLFEATKTNDTEDLREIAKELTDLVKGAVYRASPADDLAQAVNAFAEWRYGGYYETRDEATRNVVGRQLWYEVSDRVCSTIGAIPPAPAFGAEGNEAK